MALMFGVVAIAQLILHCLGWGGILLGILAILVGNTGRGFELVLGGVGFIALKYVIGFAFFSLAGALGAGSEPSDRTRQ